MNLNKLKISLCYLLSICFILFGMATVYLIHINIKYSISMDTSILGTLEDVKSIHNSSKTTVAMINSNRKYVVSIYIDTKEGSRQGSGFLYNNKGDIITNAHVIQNSNNVNIKMIDSTIYNGTVIGKSHSTDIALIRVPALKNKSHLKLASNYTASIGDKIVAIGIPLGAENTITNGIISGVDRNFTIDNYKYKNMYQITSPIDNGSSGGPLLSKNTGEVIGIISAKAGESHIGFAIPIHEVLDSINTWSKNSTFLKGTRS